MDSLVSAGRVCLQDQRGQDEDTQKTMYTIRQAILESYMSLLHGMEPLRNSDGNFEKCQQLATHMYHFLDTLISLTDQNFQKETIRAIYDLFSDLINAYGVPLST